MEKGYLLRLVLPSGLHCALATGAKIGLPSNLNTKMWTLNLAAVLLYHLVYCFKSISQ
jgi:hypothetical protein